MPIFSHQMVVLSASSYYTFEYSNKKIVLKKKILILGTIGTLDNKIAKLLLKKGLK